MTKNKGYTLVELIIVMAIMAILSGVSYVTVGIIRDAKRSSGANELNNQISSCLIRTKAISDVSSTSLCMVIKKRSNGSYAIMTGYNDGTSITDSSSHSLDPDVDANCETILPKEIRSIIYTASDTAQQYAADEMVIQFIKADGSLQYGGGTYELYTGENGTGKKFATIYVDKVSGNHYVK